MYVNEPQDKPKDRNIYFARNQITMDDKQLSVSSIKEVYMLRQLDHPNIANAKRPGWFHSKQFLDPHALFGRLA